VEEEM